MDWHSFMHVHVCIHNSIYEHKNKHSFWKLYTILAIRYEHACGLFHNDIISLAIRSMNMYVHAFIHVPNLVFEHIYVGLSMNKVARV